MFSIVEPIQKHLQDFRRDLPKGLSCKHRQVILDSRFLIRRTQSEGSQPDVLQRQWQLQENAKPEHKEKILADSLWIKTNISKHYYKEVWILWKPEITHFKASVGAPANTHQCQDTPTLNHVCQKDWTPLALGSIYFFLSLSEQNPWSTAWGAELCPGASRASRLHGAGRARGIPASHQARQPPVTWDCTRRRAE